MLLSVVSVLVVAQSSSEIPEGLMNNPVHYTSESNIGLDVYDAAGEAIIIANKVLHNRCIGTGWRVRTTIVAVEKQ